MNMLFVRLGAIGDVIQAAAALRIFKDRHPDITIDWVIDSAYVGLIQSFGVADKVIGINSKSFLTGNIFSRCIGLIKAQFKLGFRLQYDVLVTAHPDWRYNVLSVFVGTKKRITPQDLENGRGFITTQNRTSEYLRLLKLTSSSPLNSQNNDDVSVDKAIANLGLVALSSYRGAYSSQLSSNLPLEYIAIVPGGAKNTLRDDPLRRWPIASYVELARALISSGKNILLLGGPDDQWVNQYFEDLPVSNLIGKTNLLDMVHLLDKAQATICHDSGPLHLASITNTPLITIFGPTPASAVISSTRIKTAILEPGKEISCSPCYDGKNYAACNNNICMQNSSVNQVLEKLNMLLLTPNKSH
ncbi:glycosyltransferase family 9 protein [Polynucleobacter sp. UB-Piko-W3]|uniref:glycosyltransferase family 9 protein n=1 Tax=Polynucleobacter sp. UB-Piko-W3 TaxID=1819735 RepID=UPI001C0DA9D7|nr:glycosyltransferase family 9 protein [Polynucleobacter sp. UB-Piko-W3]MBU3555997.1 glycosyltransferase family 9 protein [Polynucleobacter sp. UB-Piko-W3]